MLAHFLRSDDPNDLLAAPRVGHAVNIRFDAAKGYEPQFAVVLAVIDPFDDLVRKNLRGGEKRDTVLREVLRRLVLVLLKLQFIDSSPTRFLIHDCVHNINEIPTAVTGLKTGLGGSLKPPRKWPRSVYVA